MFYLAYFVEHAKKKKIQLDTLKIVVVFAFWIYRNVQKVKDEKYKA